MLASPNFYGIILPHCHFRFHSGLLRSSLVLTPHFMAAIFRAISAISKMKIVTMMFSSL